MKTIDIEEKVQEYQCIHCGQCEKDLPCPQDLKRLKIWQEYFDSHKSEQEDAVPSGPA